MDRDYRTRTDPATGKIIKYDRGHKRAWYRLVRNTAADWMVRMGLEPFPKNHPIAIGCAFFVTKSKTCKLDMPSQTPDMDNLEYTIWNALKRTVKRKGNDCLYPNGVCFFDDDQIIYRVQPSGVYWADEEHPPGVVVTILDALAPAVMEEYLTSREMASEII